MRTVTPEEASDAQARLATMIDFVNAAAARLDDAAAHVRAADGTFSLVEQVWHLADLERDGFAVRIERLATEEHPHLADFDGARAAEERAYATLPLAEGLATFAASRRTNLARLAALGPDAWARDGEQDGVGRVCLGDLPAMMVAHDAEHRAQIEALLAELHA